MHSEKHFHAAAVRAADIQMNTIKARIAGRDRLIQSEQYENAADKALLELLESGAGVTTDCYELDTFNGDNLDDDDLLY